MIVIQHKTEFSKVAIPFRPWRYFCPLRTGLGYPKYKGFVFDNKKNRYLVYWRGMKPSEARSMYQKVWVLW